MHPLRAHHGWARSGKISRAQNVNLLDINRAGGARLIRSTLGNGYVRILYSYTGRNVDVVWPRGDSPLKGSSPAAGRGIQRC